VASVRLTPGTLGRCVIERSAELEAAAATLRERIENG
jgi:hypothetical protein